jgi:hypothetical protein
MTSTLMMMDDPSSSSVSASAASSAASKMTFFDNVKRCYVLFLTACGIGMSVIVGLSCEFFAFRALDNEPWPALSPPFNTITEASIGLFSYSTEPGQKDAMVGGDSCTTYGAFLEAGQGQFFLAAQYCSIAAPFAALLAFVLLVSETVYCRLKGSFVWVPLLLLSATVLQGCTFLVHADGSFW